MQYKELKLGDQVIGKYIEIDTSKYETKLIYSNANKTLGEFVNSENALAGINGGLFSKDNVVGILKTSSGEIIGEGDSNVPYILCKDSQITSDWNLSHDNLKKYDWARSAAYYGFLNDGNYGEFTLVPNVEDGINQKKYRSMIGQKSNGNIIIASTTKKVNGKEQADALINLGCTIGLNLDGGSSTQLYTENNYIVSALHSHRKITDALLVFEKKVEPIVPTPTGKCSMKLFGSAARLRDNVVDGNIITTIPNGTEFDVIGIYSWKAADGYRWGYGKWNGYEGYFQYDPAVMMPLGSDLNTLNYKMRLFNSAARIRTKPVNGNVLTTVPNGNDITIIQFGKIKESDGYQWFQGSFNGITGFLQYDPAVMFPTND